MATGEKHKQYERENIKAVRVAFNRKTEPDLVRWIETKPNMSRYIKLLVAKDMERERARLKRLADKSERATRTNPRRDV